MPKIGPISTSIPQRQGILYSLDEVIKPLVVKSTVRDTGVSPTTTLRGGLCLVKESGGDDYIRADDAAAPSGSPASVSAIEAADAGWQSATLTFLVNHGLSFDVVLGAGDDTNQEVVDALNADALFAAELFADISGGFVRIRTIRGGPQSHVKVTCDLDTAFGADGVEDAGAFPDFAVLKNSIDLLENGTAEDQPAPCITQRGRFDESELVGLTPTCKAALQAQGCIFE